jgi:hypothetical protein
VKVACSIPDEVTGFFNLCLCYKAAYVFGKFHNFNEAVCSSDYIVLKDLKILISSTYTER